MRLSGCALVAWMTLSAVAETPQDPKVEWQAKLDVLRRKTAASHAQLAAFCGTRKLFEYSYREYLRAAALDPSNAEAQKAVGRKKDGEAWVEDPKSSPRKLNEGPPDTWKAAAEEYQKKRAAAAEKAAKDYEGLAQWAAKAGMDPEARALWKELVRWYDPAHEKAHQALGDTREGDAWVSKRDADNRAAAQKRIREATEGSEVTAESEIERVLHWKMTKRKSGHFDFQFQVSDANAKEVVKSAEAVRAFFMEIYSFRDDSFFQVMQAVCPGSAENYGTYVDCMPGLSAGDRKDNKSYSWFPMYQDPPLLVGWSSDPVALKDEVIHCEAHFLVWNACAGMKAVPAWLREGLAWWMTDRFNKTSRCFCMNVGTGYRSWDLRNPLTWRMAVVQALQDGLDMDMREMLTVNSDALTGVKALKCWSMVDWLTDGERQAFVLAWDDWRQGKDQAAALFDRLGVKDFAEMNEKWKKWVDENY